MGDNLPAVDLGTGRIAKKIFTGQTHTCAILDDDSTKCWGSNTYGQLGLGDVLARGDSVGEMGDALPALNLGTGKYAKSLALGSSSTCAILNDNSVKCWGRNNRGQLLKGNTANLGDGAGEMGDALTAVNLGTGRSAKAITAGSAHFCAILDNNATKCWGQGSSGQLGQGSTSHLGDGATETGDNIPFVNLGTGRYAVEIKSSAMANFNCAILDDGTTKCWGYNTYGNLGQGTTANRGDGAGEMGDALAVTDFGAGIDADQIGVGYFHACMLNIDQQVKCWGRATNGALGNGSTTLNLGDAINEMGDLLAFVGI
jgi:alpha-tubulin suppressor-like RCC1 family protein